MGGARRAGRAVPAGLDGRARAEPRDPGAERGSAADQRPAAVDRRQLRVPGRRLPDDDGGAGRPGRAPPPAVDRRRRVRGRLAAGRLCDQPGHADRGAGPAGRDGSHADAVDARPDPRHVHRPAPADDRVRRLDGELRARRRARSRGRGHPPAPLLVGLRLPLRGAADRRAAGAGPRAAARAPGSRRRPRRQRRRRAVPGRRAQRGLRAQAGGPGRPRSGRRHRARGRAVPRGGVPAPPAPAGRPVDRPRAVPAPRLLAAARGERGVLLRPLRDAVLHGAVPPARARALPARGRSLDDPLGAGIPGRLRARPGGGESRCGPRGR